MTYRYTPETCPSKHWNDGNDTCEDCGADLNEAPEPLEPRRIFLVYSCNEHGEELHVHRTLEEAEAMRCSDFETEEKPGSEEWNDEWVQVYQNAGWYCWEVEALNLDTLKLEPVDPDACDWAKVAELVGWKDEDEEDDRDRESKAMDLLSEVRDCTSLPEDLTDRIDAYLNYEEGPPVRRTTTDFAEQSERIIAADERMKDAETVR